MKTEIKLSEEIIKKINDGYLPAKELCAFLIDNGFNSCEHLERSKITDLYIDGSKVISATIDLEYNIISIETKNPEHCICIEPKRKNAKDIYFIYKTRRYCLNKHGVICKFSSINGKKYFQHATLDFDIKEKERIIKYINNLTK